MARRQDWQVEAQEARRREMWTLRGPTQIVKVVAPAGGSPATEMGGYITLGKFLLGKTPQQIEQALGLKRDYLKNGARIYRFARLPLVQEYEYELTTHYPDGLAFNPAHSNPTTLREAALSTSGGLSREPRSQWIRRISWTCCLESSSPTTG